MDERNMDLYNDECHLEDLKAIQSLKEKLLSIELCINNEYLDRYCELIIANKNTSFIKKQSNKHHIVPKYYYKIKKIQVDNSNNNLVVLSRKNHALAHYYLLKCSFNKRILNYNLYSLKYILPSNIKVQKLQDDIFSEIIKDLDNYHYEFTEEHRRKISLAGIGNQYNKGKKWSKESRKKCSERQKGHKHSEETKRKMREHSYYKGKHLSEETKRKISNSKKGKKMSKEFREKISKISKSWTRSAETRKKMSLKSKGRIWINDGKNRKMIFPEDFESYKIQGWKRGWKL